MNEIELKLLITEESAVDFIKKMDSFAFLQKEEQFLTNCYYDTADNFFASHKMGLRVRGKNQQFELTLKTNGEVENGLHIRSEYNIALTDSTPDLNKLVKKYNLEFDWINLPLLPVFSTDFHRTIWLVKMPNCSEIEIALDLGWICAGTVKERICEIELELKKGEKADLFLLLQKLNLVDVAFYDLSKAQRGYALAKNCN